MKLPTLYSRTATGKIVEWTIEVKRNKVITTWGEQYGKKQSTTETVKCGTNIGKKNERNPQQQAEFIAKSKWKAKQARHGYADNLKNIITNNPNPTVHHKPYVIRPMLAKKYQEHREKVKFPVYLQPKLDGIRCIGNATCAMSRKGLLFYGMEHIQKQLHSLYEAKLPIPIITDPSQFYLDGELYHHGTSFQNIQSIVLDQKPNPLKNNIQFWIYDCFYLPDMTLSYKTRHNILEKLFSTQSKSKKDQNQYPNLVLTPTTTVKNEAQIMKAHEIAIKNGYEGVMIREPSSPYRLNYRSSSLLKYKSFQDAEFKIVGFKEGKGKDKGTVIWEVETRKKQRFYVRPGGTVEERKRLFQTGSQHMGKWLNVRYVKLSDDGIPQHILEATIREIK